MSEEQKNDDTFVESPNGDGGVPGDQPESAKEPMIYCSHDGLFRFAFDKKRVAESFVKENLPAEILKYLDFSTLTSDKDTFIDQKLSRCYSDVLYRIQYREKPAYLYFLFEHKSWEPEFPGVQLLKNMTYIWEKYLSQHKGAKTLPVIIPLLIYHGEKPWKGVDNFEAKFELSDALKKYVPVFHFEVYDISHMPEDKIRGIVELRIVFLMLRYIFQPEMLERLKNVLILFRELTDRELREEFLKVLALYLGANVKGVPPEQIQAAVHEVLEDGGAIMSTVFQQLIERGKEIAVKEKKDFWVKEGKNLAIKENKDSWVKEGKDIGFKEGKDSGYKEGEDKSKIQMVLACIRKGLDLTTISEISGLSMDQLKLLKLAAS